MYSAVGTRFREKLTQQHFGEFVLYSRFDEFGGCDVRLEEAFEKIENIVGIPFEKLFSPEDIQTIIINKGKSGQLLELTLGKNLDSGNIDFENGELKTNKCDHSGKPLETIFVTQVSSIIDELLQKKHFEDTHLYEKISNLLYVPVCKEGNPKDWCFLKPIHIDLSLPQYAYLLEVWKNDYYSICDQLIYHIEHSKDGFIHTSNGKHLQIRSKDRKNSNGEYHPIYSHIYGRNVSNKNHAFYFKKVMVNELRKV